MTFLVHFKFYKLQSYWKSSHGSDLLFLSFSSSDWPFTGLAFSAKSFSKHLCLGQLFYHELAKCRKWEILLHVYHSNFSSFLCTSHASLSSSLWSRYHWKYILLLQNLSIHVHVDDANFDQRWWYQNWNKANTRHGQLPPAWESMG